MYGVIHKALEEMVIGEFGLQNWNKIKKAAGVNEDAFVRMQAYDDKTTYALIGAASEILETPADQCLELFGKYWISQFATKTYDQLLTSTGRDFVSFISNVNVLHDRITSSFPDYVPPEFYLRTISQTTYELTYLSTRTGLAPFVRGLLQGLADRFKCQVTITNEQCLATKNGEHWVFTLDLDPDA